MLKSLGRFVIAVARSPYAWVGLILLVAPLAAYYLPAPKEQGIGNFWIPEERIWPTFAGALLMLWAAFRAWEERSQPASGSSVDSLRTEIADLRRQLDAQKRRYLTSDQRTALVQALRESGEPIHITVVYDHLDYDAEAYAAQFSAVLKPARFAGDPIPLDDIPANLEGVVIRTNGTSVSTLAQRFSGALTKAKIAHQIQPLTGVRAHLAPSDYFDLVIARRTSR
jgi:hypothetical protein